MDEPYIWKKLNSRLAFSTPYYQIQLDRLLHPRGHELDYFVIDFARQAVGVVPILPDGSILLVQQWRHTIQKTVWSIPAGAMESGETPIDAARRELHEEAGATTLSNVEFLYQYVPTIGISNQVFHVFIGQVENLAPPTDVDEILQAKAFSVDQVRQMIQENQILDGMSLTALLLYFGKNGGI